MLSLGAMFTRTGIRALKRTTGRVLHIILLKVTGSTRRTWWGARRGWRCGGIGDTVGKGTALASHTAVGHTWVVPG